MPQDVRSVVARRGPSLMAIPGVVGVGIGGSAADPVIVVLVEHLTPALRRALPGRLDGYPVEVEVSGPVTAS